MKEPVLENLASYLSGQTQSPDSVFDKDPFNYAQMRIGSWVEFDELSSQADGIQLVFNIIPGGEMNPKWLRDRYIINIQTLGVDKSKYIESESLLNDVFYTFLGGKTLYFGDSAYFQFTSDEGPAFRGYLDNSKPMFAAVITFYVDGLTDKENRKALC